MTRLANDNTLAGRLLQDKLDKLYIAPWWINLAAGIVTASAWVAWIMVLFVLLPL